VQRLIVSALLFLAAAVAAADPHTLNELLRPGEVQLIEMSPDGLRIAYVLRPREGTADALVVVDLEGGDAATAVRRFALDAGETGARVGRLDWVGDEQLLAAVQPDLKLRYRLFIGAYFYYGAENLGRLHVLDARGVNPPVTLDERFSVASFVDDRPRDPDFVTLQVFNFLGGLSLHRVRLRDGSSELQLQGDPVTSNWRVIDGKPVLKLNDVPYRKTTDVYVPAADEPTSWTRAGAYHSWTKTWEDSREIASAESPTAIYLRARHGTSNTFGIHLFNLANDRMDATIAEHPLYDVQSALVHHGKLLGWTYIADRLRQVIVDPGLRPHFVGLEKFFGADNSVEIVDIDDAGARLVVRVSGPRQPDEYHWYDMATRRAVLVVADRPWLDPARLAPMSARRVQTRDGQRIDAYLTCPQQVAALPVPLVVVPPAGPWTRGALRFNATAQAFAAQGWCVLEPNYRGVAGYGRAYEWQGYGQWSKLIVSDIAAAVDELVEAGLADAGRVVFYGEQLAAYAALAGAIEDPGRYRAGVTWNAVTDLEAVVASLRMTFSRTSPIVVRWQRYRRDELRDSSPLVRARELELPLLLIRNPALREVPVAQTDALAKAMRKSIRPPELIELPDDDSWSVTANNEILRLQHAIAFLNARLERDRPGGIP